MLSQRLQLKVAQKQILTPGLVQMVTVLQLNRLELKDMIVSEIAQNPVLEEAADGGEELTPEEVQAVLEAERVQEPADQSLRDVMDRAEPVATESELDSFEIAAADDGFRAEVLETPTIPQETTEAPASKTESDPFDEI